jgi:hypothetical protein
MLRLKKGTHTLAPLWRGRAVAAAFGVACFAASASAGAHIILVDGGADGPKDWLVMQDTAGDPQKATPCGANSPGVTTVPTNLVTTFQAGQKVTVAWNEVIAHSGHFRIVFAPVSPAAATATTLPDPVVTAYTSSADTEATTVAITATGGTIAPGAIVLADNLFPHCISGDPCAAGVPVTGAMSYSTTVTMPTTACTNCTLQLVQFMSYHPVDPSFFYHHCAAVTIVAATSGEDAGGSTGTGGSTDTGASTSTGAGTGTGASTGTGGSTSTGGSGGAGGSTSAGGSPGAAGGSGGSGGSGAGAPDGGAPSEGPAGSSPGSSSSGCSISSWGGVSGGVVCIGGLGAVAMLARGRRRRSR